MEPKIVQFSLLGHRKSTQNVGKPPPYVVVLLIVWGRDFTMEAR